MRGIYMRRGVTVTITHFYEDMCKEREKRKSYGCCTKYGLLIL
jgi:hypothetical protein